MKDKIDAFIRWFPPPFKLKTALVMIAMVFLLALAGYGVILFGGKHVVDEAALVLDAATVFETEDGEEIGSLYHEYRLPVEIKTVPKHVQQAFIAIEDRRFHKHAGVDFKSVARAVYRDILAGGKVEGASTITQQVAKNLFLSQDKTWLRKTKEIMAAIYLEKEYSKDNILELYLNSIYFGHGVYGIEAASEKYFSKSVQDLTVSEGALLAGLGKSPNNYSPINHPERALERRNIVLRAMESAGVLDTAERLQEQGKTLGLNVKEKKDRPWLASYIDLAAKEAAERYKLSMNELRRGGYRIVVHLNEDVQKIAYELFQKDAYFPGSTPDMEGAFVMKEPKSGKIIAALGGREYQLGDLNRVQVNRQPGSTFKPIAVYGPALMSDKYQPYSLLPDYFLEQGKYAVKNADNQYAGNVSMFTALMQSKNTSAVWLLDQIGIRYAKGYLKQMGMDIPDEGLSIALGGLEYGVTPAQLVDAYGMIANGGSLVESHTIGKIYDRDGQLKHEANLKEDDIFSKQVSWNLTKMLEQTAEKGTASAGSYSNALAGKTGTTQHPFVAGKNNDIWFSGFTPEYAISIWMGYDRVSKEHFVTGGSSYPTELAKQLLTEVDQLYPLAQTFEKPRGVEDIPNPIVLPVISDVQGKLTFGGLQAKLSWQGSNDERIIYHIYKEQDGLDKRIGEVKGETFYTINGTNPFQDSIYYIVPFDPLTGMEGERSASIQPTL
ncbi:penicillin-binding protein [Ornithinibacillus gellani]|uniref:transglycosylase domain-containing protein n=1 Tax=Ornithinibacillus gellani TaxID=2293253 RepID=UPI000F496646|nr:transglycosylase domain-containing protein [Ornithinibacillus gellani]TQS76633.1 penicillin-binding protein [Ornithinibacillus gellani]